MRPSCLSVFFASVFSAALAGQPLWVWSPAPTPVAPPIRGNYAMAGHPGLGIGVLFGGADANGWLADTWIWDGSQWSQTASVGPTPRGSHAMAANDQTVFLFGGSNGTGKLGDLWEFRAGVWQPAQPAPGPAARELSAMAWDERRGELVLFGGRFGGSLVGNDTWTWKAGTWTRHSTGPLPAAREDHAMAYDPVRRRVVMFGGDSNGLTLQDTWEWDGVQWTQVRSTRFPFGQGRLVMTYSPARQRVILAGTRSLFDWEWDGSDWAPGWPSTASTRGKGIAQISASHGVLFAGLPSASATGDTWVSGIPTTTLFGSPCGPGPQPTLVAGAARLGQPRAVTVDDFPAMRGAVWLVGGSDQQWGAVPLPASLTALGAPGCELLVSGDLVTPFYSLLGGRLTFMQLVPANPALVGAAVFDQVVVFDPLANPAGIVTTNGVKSVIEGPVLTSLVEEFDNETNLDRAASSGSWVGGAAVPGVIGGNGRLGPFDPSDGVLVSSIPGAMVYEWSTDQQTIPGVRTLTGRDITVTDGVFDFSRFDVAAGVTVRFVGSNRARISVRGRAHIEGRVELNAPPVPLISRVAPPLGQVGGVGGPGGASGGSGADAGSGLGHTAAFNGRPGGDVALPAGHAYAARAATTGGRGSQQFPADGLNSSVTYAIHAAQFCGQTAAGGGGGGFGSRGTRGRAVFSGSGELGPDGIEGVAFSPHPLPPGSLSSEHFAIGGSGGGGGGSHPHFSLLGTPPVWRAGAAGGGGGGTLVLRCGHEVNMAPGSLIEAKGGDGGSGQLAAPPHATGGGGSGGSVLVQTGGLATMAGLINTRGGTGGLFDERSIYLATIQGGDGAAGLARVEVPQPNPPISVAGVAIPVGSLLSVGTLAETDSQVACQSSWYWTGRALPVTEWVRYRMDATINGQQVTFSDDPALGSLASGAVGLFVQAATIDPATGIVDPSSMGPWRQRVGGAAASLQSDGGNAYRFVILFDRAVAQQVQVDRVAVDFRG